MGAFTIRFAGPVIGFLLGAGLEVGGFNDVRVAFGLWSAAGLWAVVALLSWERFQRYVPVRIHWQLPITFQNKHKNDKPGGNIPLVELQSILDYLPLLIRSEINYVHFGWLWKDDPYVSFGINIWNLLPYDLELTGVKGSANINGTACTREAEMAMPRDFRAYKKGNPPYSVADFYQPITQKHAETLQNKLQGGQPIPFDLSPIEWVGTLATPTGKIALPLRLVCDGQFEVDGARISPDHSQASVGRTRLVGTGPIVLRTHTGLETSRTGTADL